MSSDSETKLTETYEDAIVPIPVNSSSANDEITNAIDLIDQQGSVLYSLSARPTLFEQVFVPIFGFGAVGHCFLNMDVGYWQSVGMGVIGGVCSSVIYNKLGPLDRKSMFVAVGSVSVSTSIITCVNILKN